jgi:hypothetical protein
MSVDTPSPGVFSLFTDVLVDEASVTAIGLQDNSPLHHFLKRASTSTYLFKDIEGAAIGLVTARGVAGAAQKIRQLLDTETGFKAAFHSYCVAETTGKPPSEVSFNSIEKAVCAQIPRENLSKELWYKQTVKDLAPVSEGYLSKVTRELPPASPFRVDREVTRDFAASLFLALYCGTESGLSPLQQTSFKAIRIQLALVDLPVSTASKQTVNDTASRQARNTPEPELVGEVLETDWDQVSDSGSDDTYSVHRTRYDVYRNQGARAKNGDYEAKYSSGSGPSRGATSSGSTTGDACGCGDPDCEPDDADRYAPEAASSGATAGDACGCGDPDCEPDDTDRFALEAPWKIAAGARRPVQAGTVGDEPEATLEEDTPEEHHYDPVRPVRSTYEAYSDYPVKETWPTANTVLRQSVAARPEREEKAEPVPETTGRVTRSKAAAPKVEEPVKPVRATKTKRREESSKDTEAVSAKTARTKKDGDASQARETTEPSDEEKATLALREQEQRAGALIAQAEKEKEKQRLVDEAAKKAEEAKEEEDRKAVASSAAAAVAAAIAVAEDDADAKSRSTEKKEEVKKVAKPRAKAQAQAQAEAQAQAQAQAEAQAQAQAQAQAEAKAEAQAQAQAEAQRLADEEKGRRAAKAEAEARRAAKEEEAKRVEAASRAAKEQKEAAEAASAATAAALYSAATSAAVSVSSPNAKPSVAEDIVPLSVPKPRTPAKYAKSPEKVDKALVREPVPTLVSRPRQETRILTAEAVADDKTVDITATVIAAQYGTTVVIPATSNIPTAFQDEINDVNRLRVIKESTKMDLPSEAVDGRGKRADNIPPNPDSPQTVFDTSNVMGSYISCKGELHVWERLNEGQDNFGGMEKTKVTLSTPPYKSVTDLDVFRTVEPSLNEAKDQGKIIVREFQSALSRFVLNPFTDPDVSPPPSEYPPEIDRSLLPTVHNRPGKRHAFKQTMIKDARVFLDPLKSWRSEGGIYEEGKPPVKKDTVTRRKKPAHMMKKKAASTEEERLAEAIYKSETFLLDQEKYNNRYFKQAPAGTASWLVLTPEDADLRSEDVSGMDTNAYRKFTARDRIMRLLAMASSSDAGILPAGRFTVQILDGFPEVTKSNATKIDGRQVSDTVSVGMRLSRAVYTLRTALDGGVSVYGLPVSAHEAGRAVVAKQRGSERPSVFTTGISKSYGFAEPPQTPDAQPSPFFQSGTETGPGYHSGVVNHLRVYVSYVAYGSNPTYYDVAQRQWLSEHGGWWPLIMKDLEDIADQQGRECGNGILSDVITRLIDILIHVQHPGVRNAIRTAYEYMDQKPTSGMDAIQRAIRVSTDHDEHTDVPARSWVERHVDLWYFFVANEQTRTFGLSEGFRFPNLGSVVGCTEYAMMMARANKIKKDKREEQEPMYKALSRVWVNEDVGQGFLDQVTLALNGPNAETKQAAWKYLSEIPNFKWTDEQGVRQSGSFPFTTEEQLRAHLASVVGAMALAERAFSTENIAPWNSRSFQPNFLVEVAHKQVFAEIGSPDAVLATTDLIKNVRRRKLLRGDRALKAQSSSTAVEAAVSSVPVQQLFADGEQGSVVTDMSRALDLWKYTQEDTNKVWTIRSGGHKAGYSASLEIATTLRRAVFGESQGLVKGLKRWHTEHGPALCSLTESDWEKFATVFGAFVNLPKLTIPIPPQTKRILGIATADDSPNQEVTDGKTALLLARREAAVALAKVWGYVGQQVPDYGTNSRVTQEASSELIGAKDIGTADVGAMLVTEDPAQDIPVDNEGYMDVDIDDDLLADMSPEVQMAIHGARRARAARMALHGTVAERGTASPPCSVDQNDKTAADQDEAVVADHGARRTTKKSGRSTKSRKGKNKASVRVHEHEHEHGVAREE